MSPTVQHPPYLIPCYPDQVPFHAHCIGFSHVTPTGGKRTLLFLRDVDGDDIGTVYGSSALLVNEINLTL